MTQKMRVLVLDDEEARHVHFRSVLRNQDATFCFNFDEVVHAMTFEDRYDLVMLDHDLGTGNSQNAMMVGLPNADGYDVAKFIAHDLEEAKRPTRAIIHSWNHIGAANMEAVLRDVGIDVWKKPFQL